MKFTTYENRRNRHVAIHSNGCNQLRKRGGKHKHGQGHYQPHLTYKEAKAYAESRGLLPIINCSFCHPEKHL